MLIHSAEVRWFFPGILQDAVLDAFDARRESVRHDRYLRLRGVDAVGVKLRQGRLEVKARRGPIETVALAEGVSGNCDCWVKWACAADKLDQLTALLAEDTREWIDVQKERCVRVYGDATTGCHVELTKIVVDRAHWWTLGIEAIGPADQAREQLRRGAAVFFAEQYRALTLDAALAGATSASYPMWLASLP